MKVRTVRVSKEGRVSVGRDLAGQQFEATFHEDGRIELVPVLVLRKDQLPASIATAIDRMNNSDVVAGQAPQSAQIQQ